MSTHTALVAVKQGPLLTASSQALELVQASISANTRRAYKSALARFDQAIGDNPVTDTVVANYLAALYDAKKSPATCSQVVAALKFRAKLQDIPPPVGSRTNRVLAGIRRQGRERGRGQVNGVNFSQAEAAAAIAAGEGSVQGLRDSAVISVMSDGLLRVSELVALQVHDLAFEPDGGRVTIRHSKTDQEGVGVVLYLGPPTMGRVKAWLEAAGIIRGPLFRRLYRGGKVGGEKELSTESVRQIIKRRCSAAGVGGSISGHSLRVGGAESLAAGGASIAEMQTAGRWRSPTMPGHYARGQLAARGAVARIRYHR